MRTVLDVHRDAVEQSLFHQRAEPFGEGTVCVKLHAQPLFLNLVQKRGKLVLKQRLSAGNYDAVQKPAPAFQKIPEIFLCELRLRRAADDEPCVMAEGTSEITSAREDGAGHKPRIIQ